jgi:hypothetical protein
MSSRSPDCISPSPAGALSIGEKPVLCKPAAMGLSSALCNERFPGVAAMRAEACIPRGIFSSGDLRE